MAGEVPESGGFSSSRRVSWRTSGRGGWRYGGKTYSINGHVLFPWRAYGVLRPSGGEKCGLILVLHCSGVWARSNF